MKDGNEIYAEMLEMPVSSCDVIFKPAKKKKRNALKEKVIEKVNFETEPKEEENGVKETSLTKNGNRAFKLFKKKERAEIKDETAVETKKKKFSFDIVYAEGVAVFLLVATILLTNIFWEGSGINAIMKKAFQKETVVTDARPYGSFSLKSPSDDLAVSLENGVITLSGEGAIYPVCDGTLTSVKASDGTYTLTVSHSDIFKTEISGLDYVYAEEGNEVYKYIPIGYVSGGNVTVSMFNDGVLLTGYILEGGNIVWES